MKYMKNKTNKIYDFVTVFRNYNSEIKSERCKHNYFEILPASVIEAPT